MPFLDLGHKFSEDFPDTESPSEEEEKISYPSVFIRHKAGDEIPEFPDGEFWIVAKARVEGMRKDRDGSGSHDIEIMKLAPVDASGAKALAEANYEEEEDEIDGKFSQEAAKNSFRAALSQDDDDDLDGPIGQSG